MKKLLSLVSLTLLSFNVALADFKLILTSEEGNQTEYCVKSYSFSNNLEALSRKKGVYNDIYSTEETMTNKIYKGKVVYRKIIEHNSLLFDGEWRHINYNPDLYIDEVVYSYLRWKKTEKKYSHLDAQWDEKGQYIMDFYANNEGWGYALGSERKKELFSGVEIFLEYTKTTDTFSNVKNIFKSYIHYTSSSIENEEIVTKEINNIGIQILDGYSYNKENESCIKK